MPKSRDYLITVDLLSATSADKYKYFWFQMAALHATKTADNVFAVTSEKTPNELTLDLSKFLSGGDRLSIIEIASGDSVKIM